MAKAKLSLTLAPTFKAPVQIPVPGARPVSVEFTFKYRDRDAFKEFLDGLHASTEDVDLLLDIASGWELDEPFEKASLEKMVKTYIGSAAAVLNAYIAESTGARAKN